MPSSLLFFPSGRSVERCRQDAKSLVKISQSSNKPMSLSEALDKIASDNGINLPWAHAIKKIKEFGLRKAISLKPKKPKVAQMHLIGHALNLLIKKKLIDINSTEESKSDFLECQLLEKPTVINWNYISCGEIRISVWWNFDKTKHPQHLEGGYKSKILLDYLPENEQRKYWAPNKVIHSKDSCVESYRTSTPLAKRSRYKDFVGVLCSTWIERETGKYLQTEDGRKIFDSYVRNVDKKDLCNIPDCKPMSFSLSGRFHL